MFSPEDFYKELDYPPLPYDLEQDAYSCISLSSQYYARQQCFMKYRQSTKMKDWITANIVPQLDGYQLSDSSIQEILPPYGTKAPHTDAAGETTIFYILDQGGIDVQTNWFIEKGFPLIRKASIANTTVFDDLEKCYSTIVPLRKWVMLHSNILHNVSGVTDTRVSIALRLTQVGGVHWRD
jgi:hypothetical protein